MTGPRRRRPAAAAVGVLAALALGSACSGSEPGAGGGTPADAEPAGALVQPSPPAVSAGGDGAAGAAGAAGGQEGRAGGDRGKGRTDPRGNDAGMPVLGKDRVQTDVLRRLPGAADGGCVEVGPERDVRSGGLAAGPFDQARAAWQPEYGDARVVRLYVVPQHAAGRPRLRLTATRAGSDERVSTSQDAWSEADQFRFYDVRLAIPRAGRWEISGQAGADRGCWVVDLG